MSVRVPLDKTALKADPAKRLSIAEGRQLIVYERGTTNQATGYTSQTGDTQVTYPLLANSEGRFDAWYPPGEYDLYDPTDGSTQPWDAVAGLDSRRIAVLSEAIPVAEAPEFGAKGNGIDDDTAALQAAADAQRPVRLTGVYKVSEPIEMRAFSCFKGEHSTGWFERDGERGVIKADGEFAGEAIVQIRDKAITGSSDANRNGRIEGVLIDGNNRSGEDIIGILLHGETPDWTLENVQVKSCSGHGIRMQRRDGGDYQQTAELIRVNCTGNGGHGFSAEGATDLNALECQMNSNLGNGWDIEGSSSIRLTSCRAEWNGIMGGSDGHGLRLHGVCDKIVLPNFITDRNDKHGVFLDDVGPQSHAILMPGAYLHRDGRNQGDGGGDYAGLAVHSTENWITAPVLVSGLVVHPGVDDGGGGAASPAYGVSFRYTAHFAITGGGMIWGVTDPIKDTFEGAVWVDPTIYLLSGWPSPSATRVAGITYTGDGKLGNNLTADNSITVPAARITNHARFTVVGSSPSLPGPDQAALFFDESGGKKRLRVKMPDGNEHTIWTEP